MVLCFLVPVSYTHLDVYKRQAIHKTVTTILILNINRLITYCLEKDDGFLQGIFFQAIRLHISYCCFVFYFIKIKMYEDGIVIQDNDLSITYSLQHYCKVFDLLLAKTLNISLPK